LTSWRASGDDRTGVSESYPTIQDRLSEMEREFMGCVEMHLDPPEDDERRYKVQALYRYGAGDWDLPGNAIRFTIAVDEADPELTERLHVIEFLTLNDGGPPEIEGRVLHAMKRVEAQLGRYFWTESQFQVNTPEFPRVRARAAEVEEEVKSVVDRIHALDRSHGLVPVEAP
jgi:hypothetical protein